MRPAFKYLMLFILFFTVSGAGAYFAVIAITESADEVVLPRLVGKDLANALEILTRLGLNTKLMGSDYDTAIPRNHILSQDPAPGTLIRKGRDIMIRISTGKKEIVVPDLKGLTWQQAVILLENMGLKPGTVSKTYSDTVIREAVLAQAPVKGANVSQASSVNLLISQGAVPSLQVMPDLTGLSLSKATARLASLQMEISEITREHRITSPGNAILAQEPFPGWPATRGQRVSLRVNAVAASKDGNRRGINGVSLVTHRLEPGFLNKHVRIQVDMYGCVMDLHDQFMAPGETASIVVPQGVPAEISIFVDGEIVRTEKLFF